MGRIVSLIPAGVSNIRAVIGDPNVPPTEGSTSTGAPTNGVALGLAILAIAAIAGLLTQS